MKHRVTAAAVLLACACAHGPAAPEPTPLAPKSNASPSPAAAAPIDVVAALRDTVDALLRDQAELYWRRWTTGEAIDVSRTWSGRERLASPETIAAVGSALAKAAGTERRALSYLRAFLVGEYLARETADAAERAAVARATATVAWDGQQLAAREVPAVLAAEPEPGRRIALARAQAASASRFAALADAEQAALEAAVRKLGYPSPLTLAAELRGRPVEALVALAEGVLAASDALYRSTMEDLARHELGLPLGSVRGRDTPRLFRAAADRRAFPAARMWPDAAAILVGLGFDVASQTSLRLDPEPRPGKNPRPLMLPVEVPGGIRISFVPTEGADALRALLNELGAGEFYAHATSPVMEFRRLGPASVPAAWGLVFAGIAADPAWVAGRAVESDKALERLVRAAAAMRLHLVRETAARVLFEVERARDPARASEQWARIASRAFARPIDADEASAWRADPDPLLHAADTLRAILLSAQAEAFLARRAGAPAWWRSRPCGEWLAETWAAGSSRTPEELSEGMGFPALDAGALVETTRTRWAAASSPSP